MYVRDQLKRIEKADYGIPPFSNDSIKYDMPRMITVVHYEVILLYQE